MPNPTPRLQVAEAISSLIEGMTHATPGNIFGVDITDDDSLTGFFTQAGELLQFEVNPTGFAYVESENKGALAYISGMKIPSSLELRSDKQDVCKTGKLCGDICIPKGSKCRQGLSHSQQQSTVQARAIVQQQKAKGDWKTGLLIGGAVLGVAAVGVGAAIASAGLSSSFRQPQPVKMPTTEPEVKAATLALQPQVRNQNATQPIANSTIVPPGQMGTVSDPWAGASPAQAQSSQPDKVLTGGEKPALSGRVSPAIAPQVRNQNVTQSIANSTLVTPVRPFKATEIADPWAGVIPQAVRKPAKGKEPQSERLPVTSKPSSSPDSKTRPSPIQQAIEPSVNPIRTEVDKQTDKLVRKHKPYAATAQRLTDDRITPSALSQAEQTLSRLEVRHRQMMNPLQENYFGAAAQEARALSKQLSTANGAVLNLKARLLKGRSLEQHQKESSAALSELADHSKRIQSAYAAIASGGSSPVQATTLSRLKQQQAQVESLTQDIHSVRQASTQLSSLQPQINDLQKRLSVIPTRLNQLDERTQAQHRQVQRIRKLQGDMPGRVAQFARSHSNELDELDKHIDSINKVTTDHDSSRQFGIASVQSIIERRQSLISQDLYLLQGMSGKDGIKWVTSKDSSEVPRGLELVISRAKQETGVSEITDLGEAAKFRQHVIGKLSNRIEGYLGDIEKRSAYIGDISQKAIEEADKHVAGLQEFQKKVVIEGGDLSRSLIKDLQKTAQGTSVQLAGSAVQQPYRQAHEFLVQDIQNAHAQKTRAVSESLVSAQMQRDRLDRIAKEPAVFEINGKAKPIADLESDNERVRAEIKAAKALTTVKLGSVQLSEESQRQQVTKQNRLAQNETVKAQISDLQGKMGEVTQQIRKREEAASRGQRKGINTGKLEAERAAIQRQIETLAQHFTGMEKRDSRWLSA